LREKGYATAVLGGWCANTFSLIDCGFEEVDVTGTQNHRWILAEAAFNNHLLADFLLDNPLGRLLLPEIDRASFGRGAASLTGRVERWLDGAAAAGRPFFLVAVYHATHLPYASSYPYYGRFVDPGYRGRNRYRIDFRIDEMIRRGFDHDLTAPERRHIVDLYDGCVQEFDDQVGAVVDRLRALGLLDHTIVGVWADHGDDLYEHGTTLGHGVTLFGGDQANHVPAVFAGPGIPVRRVEALVRSYDLAPTWASWVGFGPAEGWRGVDLSGPVPDLTALLETSYLLYRQPVPDRLPGERPRPFPRLDQATFLDPDFDHNLVLRPELRGKVMETKSFAVRQGRWKLIYVPGVERPIYRLYDLLADPQCRRDLAREGHPEVERLKWLLPPRARGGS
ncbi:MAG: sulfatase, partial [Planctomycetota bacterium]